MTLHLAPADEIDEPLTLKVVIQRRAMFESGDPVLYFGDEQVQPGDPVLDSNGNLRIIVVDGKELVVTYTDDDQDSGIDDGTKVLSTNADPIFHGRRDPVWVNIADVSVADDLRNIPGAFVQALFTNDPSDVEEGPPRVAAEELCAELAPLFDLVRLSEFHFDEIVIDGKKSHFLGWSAVWRRKAGESG